MEMALVRAETTIETTLAIIIFAISFYLTPNRQEGRFKCWRLHSCGGVYSMYGRWLSGDGFQGVVMMIMLLWFTEVLVFWYRHVEIGMSSDAVPR